VEPVVERRTGPSPALGVGAVVLAFGGLSLGSTLAKSSGSPGAVVALWRFAIAAVLWHLIVATSARRREMPVAAGRGRNLPSLTAWRAAAVPGVLFGVNLSCFFSGVERTPIAHAEFISACAPLILVPLGAWRLRERVQRQVLAGGAVALGGVVLILATKSSAATSVGGDLLVAGSMLAWVAYLMLAKSARQRVGTADFMAVMSTAAFATTLVITLATSGPAEMFGLSAKGWLIVAVLAVTSGVVSHGLIAWAQQRVAVGTVSMLQLAQPALGVLWAATFLGESVRPAQLAGMALVLGAVATIARHSIRPNGAPSS
jgi:drug/metabolite transporter (DMT)-like permease